MDIAEKNNPMRDNGQEILAIDFDKNFGTYYFHLKEIGYYQTDLRGMIY